MEGEQPKWVGVQHRTFTAWVNQGLKPRNVKIADLPEGLKDGTAFCWLLEELSGRRLPTRISATPKSRFEKLQNASAGMNFVKSEGIPIVAIGPEDLVDPKLKLLLGLVWTLILHYQIQGISGEAGAGKGKKQNASGAKRDLLEWVKDRVKPYGVPVTNFTSSFQNGVTLAALVDSFEPGMFDVGALDNNSQDHGLWLATTVNALNKAKDLGVPPMVDAEDIVNNPDELSMMTYVSAFRNLTDSNPYGATLAGKGVEKPVVGEDNAFTVTLFAKKDKSAVILKPDTLEELEITALSPAGELEFLKAKNNNDGTYAVNFSPKKAGEYEIGVKLHGKHLNGTGRVKAIEAAPTAAAPRGDAGDAAKAAAPAPRVADASKSTAEGEGLAGGSTTKPSNFLVTARDSSGQPLGHAGPVVTVDVEPVGGSALAEEDQPFAEVYDEGDGTFAVMYFTPKAGDYKVNVKLDGAPIKDSPFTSKIRQAPSAANCTVKFPNKDAVVVGKPEQLIIEARDETGAPLKEGGLSFRVAFETGGADAVESTQKDNGDGTYVESFTCPVPGKYSVDVSIGGQSISGSPISFDVRKGLPSAEKSSAEGPGLEHAWTFRPARFTLTTRDQDGNPLQAERGTEYTIDVDGPSGPLPTIVRDHGDGSYTVQYTPKQDGPITVALNVAGKPIPGSTFKLASEQLVSVDNSKVEGEGITKLTTGKPSTFLIRCFDKKGQPVKEGGDAWAVDIKRPDGQPVSSTIRDNRDGTYSVRYVPSKTGEYIVSPSLYGKPIKDAPFYVNADRAKDFAAFSFTSKDGEGKGIVDTVTKFDVHVDGPAGQTVDYTTTDIDEGQYGVDFRPAFGPGTYKIHVKLDGEHIANSPFEVKVGGDEGGQPPVKFPFTPKDKEGNVIKPKRIGEFAIKVTGPDDKECKSELYDAGEGNYGVVFKPTQKGLHKISVDHNGQPIQGSVFLVNVGGGAPPAGAAGGPAPGGPAPVRFPFTPQDQSGAAIKAASPDEFQVEVAGPDAVPLKAQLAPAGDGSYGVIFTPGPPGIHTVSVKHNGKPIKGSVFRLNIGGAPAPAGGAAGGAPAGAGGAPAGAGGAAAGGAPAGAAAGAAAGGAPAGAPKLVRFKVTPKKLDGTPITFKAAYEFQVDISGPRGDHEQSISPHELVDNGDGTFAVIFDPTPGYGVYKIAVSHNGAPVEKSPFLINVGGQPAAGGAPAAAPKSAGAAAASADSGPKYDASGKPIWAPIPGRSFAKFPFKPVSASGQALTSLAGLESSVLQPDRQEIASKIQEEGDGYVVIFQPVQPGDYKIAVTYNKEPIQGVPFTVEVGGKSEQMFAASVAKFRIAAPKEKSGNPIPSSTAPSSFGLQVSGPGDKAVEAELVNNNDGSYDVQFKPFGPGTYTLNVQFGGQHIDGSPYRINIGGPQGDGSALPSVQGERSHD